MPRYACGTAFACVSIVAFAFVARTGGQCFFFVSDGQLVSAGVVDLLEEFRSCGIARAVIDHGFQDHQFGVDAIALFR